MQVYHSMNLKRHHRSVLPIDNFVQFYVADTCNDIVESLLYRQCKYRHFDTDLECKHLWHGRIVVVSSRLDTSNDSQMRHHLNKVHHSSMDWTNKDLVLNLMQHIQKGQIHFHCIAAGKCMQYQIVFVYKLPTDDIH